MQEETKRLQLQMTQQDNNSQGAGLARSNAPRPTFPKLPPFKEKTDDIDSYLFRFETHARSLGWSENLWVTYLSALLEGSALTLYHSLAENNVVSYDLLKESLLKKFQCTPDGFRKRFREAKPAMDEPFETFAVELRRLLDRWISLSKIEKSFDDLVDLILREQFLECVSKDLATFLCEKDEKTFSDMIKSAESYRRAHPTKVLSKRADVNIFGSVGYVSGSSYRGQFGAVPYRSPYLSGRENRNPTFQGSTQNYAFSAGRGNGFRGSRGRGRGSHRNFGDKFSSDVPDQSTSVVCFLCKKTGHVAAKCPWKSGKNPCRVCTLSHPDRCPFVVGTSASSKNLVDSEQSSASCSVLDTPFACLSVGEFTGKLHLESGSVNDTLSSVLRDTGATICGVRKRLVSNSQLLGTTVKCISFGGRVDEFPLATVSVRCPYFVGDLTCCVLESPVADLIVGNVPGVSVTSESSDVSGEPFSFAAVTRARAKHVVEKKPLCQISQDLNISRSDLIQKQNDDVSLKACFQLASSGEVRKSGSTTLYYYLSDGVLFRHFVKNDQSFDQVVVPVKLRPTVLSVAHDLILSGHCGSRRTLSRILSRFFWPGVTVDVAKYVASCDVCQKTVSKGKVCPVPLATVPLIGTPFDRVAVDLVGPLSPPSEQGHRYILTMIDIATRFPEAVPLKDISSVAVAEALLTIFSRLGFPKEILSDQGTQFNSDLMKQFHTLCGVKGIRASPYHPQTNGHVERFHGTLKSMLKKIVRTYPKAWHRYLPALLFACRELPSDSTGFSPFQLMFGRQVRGPIALLQESWTQSDVLDAQAKPLYTYLFELKNVIADSCKLAMENSADSALKGKKYFDKKARERRFQVDDEVLLLLPTDSNKLLASWSGPFPVVKVLHPDYKVLVKGKERIFHANMLKKYIRRAVVSTAVVPTVFSQGISVPWSEITSLTCEQEQIPSECSSGTRFPAHPNDVSPNSVLCTVGVVQDSEDALPIPTLSVPMASSMPDEDIHSIQFDYALSDNSSRELGAVFEDFQDILTPEPGSFSGDLFLEIPLTTDVPVRKKCYDIPFSAKEVVEREIGIMLDLGVIEPSNSPYASPVVLVRKKDGTCRFCIDFRSLNKITVFDAEPIPDVESLFAGLADAQFFTKIDLAKGYWQIVVKPEDRPKTAFTTHMGLFQFVRMPFGLVSAPAVFARMMRMLALHRFSAINFFDDILVNSVSWSAHLTHVKGVLSCLRSFNLTARPSKIEAGFRSLEFLGHIVGGGTMRPEGKKIDKILKISTPTTRKQVRSLLGLLSFYRRYVPRFATLSAPLSDLVKDTGRAGRSISWTPECAEALKKIQRLLCSAPVLLLPRLRDTFILRTDASSVGLGAVLLQESDDVLHPVVFASRKLLDREKAYSTIERECLAIVWAVQKFARFLWGVRFVLQTDHRPLTYLRTSNFKNSRIMRWALSLQEFSFEVHPVPGSANVFADLLSRSCENQLVP